MLATLEKTAFIRVLSVTEVTLGLRVRGTAGVRRSTEMARDQNSAACIRNEPNTFIISVF